MLIHRIRLAAGAIIPATQGLFSQINQQIAVQKLQSSQISVSSNSGKWNSSITIPNHTKHDKSSGKQIIWKY